MKTLRTLVLTGALAVPALLLPDVAAGAQVKTLEGESISMTVRDRDTDVVVSMYTDVFHDIDGCTDTSTRDRLNPGDSRVVSGPVFTYNPTGHKLRATITLCSRDGQNGMCLTETINFTP